MPLHGDVRIFRSESSLDARGSATKGKRDVNRAAKARELPRLRLGQESDREGDSEVDCTPFKTHRREWSKLEEDRVHLQRQHMAVEREMKELLAAKAELDERVSLQKQRMAVEQEMVDLLAAKSQLESVRQVLFSAREGELPDMTRGAQPSQSGVAPMQTPRVASAGSPEEPVPVEPAHDAPFSRASGVLPTLAEEPGRKEPEAKDSAATVSQQSHGELPSAMTSQQSLGARLTQDFSARRGRKQLRAPQDDQPPLFTKRGLEVVFVDTDGNDRRKHIGKRPLGATFARQLHGAPGGPIRVNHVSHGSQAQDLGLQTGWLVKEVAGQDLSNKTFEEAQQSLIDGMAHLPTA